MNFIKKIKTKLNSGKIKNDKLYLELKKYDYISFDFFDTIVKRNINTPSDVFKYIEDYAINDISNFYQLRVNAEKDARKTLHKEEITLRDIYSKIVREDSVDIYLNKELEIEYNLIVENKDIVDIIKRLKKENKKIYIISDTYFEQNFIMKILKKLNIDFFDGVYISSAYNKTKKTGNLFNEFLKKEKIDSKSLIHVGDSFDTDYIGALRNKIKCIKIPRIVNKLQNINEPDNINENIYNSFINNTMYSDDYFYKFGYENFGMFLFQYVKWLSNDIKNKGINKVYFFSRDGLIIKKAFDIVNNDKTIKSYYLEVSRRSLRVPSLWINYSYVNIINSLPFAKYISVVNIFENIGLNIDEYKEVLEKVDLHIDDILERNTLIDNVKVKKLFDCISSDLIANSKQEFNLLKKYLLNMDVNGKFATVDIGWSGGMQRFLETTLDKLNISHELYAYYIGVEQNYKKNIELRPNMHMQGYLFDFKHNENEVDRRQSFVGLLETLFLEQGGSVKNYKECENTVIANRFQYEYIVNGVETYEFKSIKKVQTGALDFIRNIVTDKLVGSIYLNPLQSFKKIQRIGENPNLKEVKIWGDFKFYDDSIEYLAKPKMIMLYLFNIKLLKKDFLNSRWKIGFLKRMLKIKASYYRLFIFLRKFK